MKRIESFCVNHDKLTPGMYLSRIDGDAVTYDVRMVTPNAGVYLENDGIHTFEHLFATYVRNTSDSDNILYVGPMGCRTGLHGTKSPKPAPSSWCRRPVPSSKILKGKSPAPAASSAETIWTTACQRQNSTPITLPKHWLAGRRKRWSISFKFFSC